MKKTYTQISNGMLIAIIINMVYAKAIGVTQGIFARQIGGDMWIATIFSIAISLCVMLLVVTLIKRYPDKNIFEHSRTLLGKWGEKLVAVLLFVFS